MSWARPATVLAALACAAALAALARAAGLPGAFPLFPALWGACLVGAQAVSGRRLLRALLGARAADRVGPSAEWALGWCTGVILTGYALSLLAFAGLLRPVPVTLVVALAALYGVTGGPPPRAARRDPAVRAWRLLPAAGKFLVGTALAVELVAALVPTLYYDALVYHYAVPEQYLRHGGFVHLPGMIYACFAFLVDLLNAVGLAWDATGVAANVFNLAFGVALLPIVADLAARTVGHRAAAAALLLWVGSPFVAIVGVLPTNDLPVLCLGMAAIHLAWSLRHVPGWRAVLVSALLAGGALFAKNVALALVLPAWGLVVITVAWRRVRGGTWRPGPAVAWVVATGLLPAVVASPTFIKNAWLTGNPLMPAAWTVLGGRDWSLLEHTAFLDEMKTHPLAEALLDAGPRSLAEVFLTGGETLGREWAGAWVLALLPALVFVRRRRGAARAFLLFALAEAALWSASFTTSRFLGPTLLCLVLASGAGLAWGWQRLGRRGRVGLGVLLAAALPAHAASFNHGMSVWQGHWLPVALGVEDPRAYVEAGTGYAEADSAAARILGPGEHVLMLGDGRSFHLRAPVVPTSAMNVSPLVRLLREGRSDDEVITALRAMGVGALLLRPNEWGRLAGHYAAWRLSDAEKARLAALLQARTRLVFRSDDGRTLLYQLLRDGGGVTSPRGTPSPG